MTPGEDHRDTPVIYTMGLQSHCPYRIGLLIPRDWSRKSPHDQDTSTTIYRLPDTLRLAAQTTVTLDRTVSRSILVTPDAIIYE